LIHSKISSLRTRSSLALTMAPVLENMLTHHQVLFCAGAGVILGHLL